MKKSVLTILSVLSLFLVFQSCSKTRTYADRLADEKKAIDRYVKNNKINIISYQRFIENDTVTDIDKNEYVELQTGLYMQIVDRGSKVDVDTFAHRDEITVRFREYNIQEGYETMVGNTNNPYFVDAFSYTKTENQVKGEFVGEGNMVGYYQTKTVPTGWLIPLDYIRYGAHIKLIISSKLGHMNSFREVYPYAYDMTEVNLSKR